MAEFARQPDANRISPGLSDAAVVDRRLLRGEQTRRTIARRAVDIASLEGLNGLSLGRLATDLGLSKSGIQALFRTKENLQLAAAASAHGQFVAAVVEPALAVPRGAARLRALIERWLTYVETPLFAGGCFWAANLVDFDSRPGPVRDVLFRQHEDWVVLLASELQGAVDAGEIADLDVNLTAFQIDAVLLAANTRLRLGDTDVVNKVRRVIEGLLGPPC